MSSRRSPQSFKEGRGSGSRLFTASPWIDGTNPATQPRVTPGTVGPPPQSRLFGHYPTLPVGTAGAGTPFDPANRIATSTSSPSSGSAQPTQDAIEQIQSEASLFAPVKRAVVLIPPVVGSTTRGASNATSGAASTTTTSNADPKSLSHATSSDNPFFQASNVRRTPLYLFRGLAVEVVVGSDPGALSPGTSSQIWWVSKALISHYSVTLRNACNRERDNTNPPRITLPETEPRVFELFYDWMLYGTYNARDQTRLTVGTLTTVNPDSQAWVPGEQLRSTEFKNYAMSRLYDQYAPKLASKPITPADVRYAFTHSAPKSKLRHLFLDSFAMHFKNFLRVLGGFKEWDVVMQDYEELRESCFTRSRISIDGFSTVLNKKTYMEADDPSPDNEAPVTVVEPVVGVKRNADGDVVKQEPKDA